MKVILSASILSCVGKNSNIVEDITNLPNVKFISKERDLKENAKIYTMELNDSNIINTLKNTLNYIVAKYSLKNSTITIKS